jgi:hypothetical protein
VGDGAPGKLLRNPGKGAGAKISAIRTRGAEPAALDNFTVKLDGDTLDAGGIREAVEVKVAGLLPFLVLKAFAIEERVKAKDSFDVVWMLSAFKEGPRSAVETIACSPVIGHADIPVAIGNLRKNFLTVDHSGAAQYANLERSDGTKEERITLRRYAHGTMAEFLKYWDQLELPALK